VFRAAFAATLSSLLVPQARALDAEAGALTFASLTTPGAGPSRVIADLASSITPGAEVYFGNGCFWGRQHEFVQTERLVLGRTDDEVSSVVGYAGGVRTPQSGKEDDKVCYYYGAPGTVYERLGHGEVVRTVLSDKSPERAASDLSAFAKTYFANFKKVVGFGMQRLDPQDSGAGYRNMIGLPGGINSPFMAIIAEENTNQMKLKQGAGNAANEKPKEDDVFNAVWIYDTDKVRVGAFPNPTHTVSAASGRVHY
jgi:peptide methionine sulfoxide reductase MsrA